MSFFGFNLIRDNEVGLVTKNMFGATMSPGQIIALHGEVGVQADTLVPGLYWRMPIVFSVRKASVVEIPPGQVGVVGSIEGKPIPAGRLLGDVVECNGFQDAKAFVQAGGCKGPQVGILLPGTHRINRAMFTVKVSPAVVIPGDKIGILTAQDGIPLSAEYMIAPAPAANTQHFADGNAFIVSGGHRGIQLETLQPGEYYINPLLFEVQSENVAQVPPGYVAVIISSVGKELEKRAIPPGISLAPSLQQPNVEDVEVVLITDETQRGILKSPVTAGKYNLNTRGYKAVLVPTSAVTIDWAASSGNKETDIATQSQTGKASGEKSTEFYKFSQLKVTSQDGFGLEVDVRLIIRIPPANASAVIARFGTVANLIEQVAHPLIDSSFRNAAGEKQAIEFVRSRTLLQEQALAAARKEFSRYHVEVQGLLIAYIQTPAALLETQTKKEIAVQQQQQYGEEAKAQESRIEVAEKTARADKQTDIIAAKLSIDIAFDKAEAARKEAAGIRDATIAKADGDAYAAQKVGEGAAAAYEAQKQVLGSSSITMIEVMKKVADGHVQITPNFLVQGGNGEGQSANLFNAFMAKTLAEMPGNKPEAQVK
jgi:hypothetical protein